MLIHYLQTLKTPILPSIQQLEKDITIDVSLKALPQLIRCLPQVETSFERTVYIYISPSSGQD